MSKYCNRKFLSEYIKLDRAISQMLGISFGGISEYITRLGAGPLREREKELISRLVRYRAYRNKLAHEVGALEGLSSITKEDVRWVRSFTSLVKKKRDSLSVFKRKEERKNAFRSFKRIALSFFGISLTILLVYAFIWFFK